GSPPWTPSPATAAPGTASSSPPTTCSRTSRRDRPWSSEWRVARGGALLDRAVAAGRSAEQKRWEEEGNQGDFERRANALQFVPGGALFGARLYLALRRLPGLRRAHTRR